MTASEVQENTMNTPISVGTRVRVGRDEAQHPSRGTWPRFRGKTGTVVEINEDRKRPHLTEYGVVFGKVRTPRSNGSIAMADAVWFKAYELRALVSQRRSVTGCTPSRGDDTGGASGSLRNEVAHVFG